MATWENVREHAVGAFGDWGLTCPNVNPNHMVVLRGELALE